MTTTKNDISEADCLRGQEELKQNLPFFLSKIPQAKSIATLKKWRCAKDIMPRDEMVAAVLDLFLQVAVQNHLAYDNIDGERSFLDRQLRLAQKSGTEADLDFLSKLSKSFIFCGPILDYSETNECLVCIEDRISASAVWIYSPGLIAGGPEDYVTGRAFKLVENSLVYHATGPAFWLPSTLETPKGRLCDILGGPVTRSDAFWAKLLRSYFRQDFPHLLERYFSGGPIVSRNIVTPSRNPGPLALPAKMPPAPKIRLNPNNPVEHCLLNWNKSDGHAVGRDRIRLHADLDMLCYVLHLHLGAQAAQQIPIAEAAKEALFILVETLIARDSAGIGTRNASAPQIRARVKEFVVKGNIPRKGLAIIEEITEAITQSVQTKRSSSNPEVAKVIARIEALEMRTTDRGFNEQEAYLAAQKLADLLDKYGAEIEEKSIIEYPTEAILLETGRKRLAPVHHTVRAVATFCDCKYWLQKDHDDTLAFYIFGLRQDSFAARALFELIEQMFERERHEFQSSDAYRQHDRGGRKAALHAFEHGLANRIMQRLAEIKQESMEKTQASTGRDLVVLKDRKIEEDLELLGMEFTRRSLSRSITDAAAFEEGFRRGESFSI